MKKIYIAGKITGEDHETMASKFRMAALALRAEGFEPINPVEVVNNPAVEWDDAMRQCIKAMMDCDGVYLLPDWYRSKGATVERHLAQTLNMPVAERIVTLKQVEWNNLQLIAQKAGR